VAVKANVPARHLEAADLTHQDSYCERRT